MGDSLNDGPVRACRLLLDLQADDTKALVRALENFAWRIEAGEIGGRGVSGGYSTGHIYELTIGDTPTHDEYCQQLDAYLQRLKAASSSEGKGVGNGNRD